MAESGYIDELSEMRWYVIHTYSGYENKVKISIEKIVENRGLGHLIYEVQVPVNTEVKVNDKGVALVSGCNPRVFSMLKAGILSPYAFMMDVLGSERYAPIVA